MPKELGGDWQKQVIGSSRATIHDTSPMAGDYGFYRAKFKVQGVQVVAEVYPDFGGERWLWGVKFPEQSEIKVWDTDIKDWKITRAKLHEKRVGGHSADKRGAMIAAEEAVKAGRPEVHESA